MARHPLSIEFLLALHHIVDLRVADEKNVPLTPPPNMPFFRTQVPLYGRYQKTHLIQVLRSLPVLTSLILEMVQI